MPIHIPSLRDRKEDIPLIADDLLVKLNQEIGRNIEGLTQKKPWKAYFNMNGQGM